MRRIEVPQDVTLIDSDGVELKDKDGKAIVISQRVVVVRALDSHEPFSKSRAADRSARAIEAAYEGATAGDTIDLADEDWRMLCEALEAPRPAGYTGMVLRRVAPLIDSILGAKEPSKEDAKPVNGTAKEAAPES